MPSVLGAPCLTSFVSLKMNAVRQFGFAVGVVQCALIVPALNLVIHPMSVLHGMDYTPWVLRLDDFYERSGLYMISLVGTPLILFALILLVLNQRLALGRAVTLLLAPFLFALAAQYLIALQVDKCLRYPELPWSGMLQLPMMSYCFVLAAIYAAISAALYCIASFIWKKLTNGSSQ